MANSATHRIALFAQLIPDIIMLSLSIIRESKSMTCYSILFFRHFVCLCYYNVQSCRFSSFYDATYAAGDSMRNENGIPFSTKDRDNDNHYTL